MTSSLLTFEELPYRCTKCGSSSGNFRTLELLRQHLHSVHSTHLQAVSAIPKLNPSPTTESFSKESRQLKQNVDYATKIERQHRKQSYDRRKKNNLVGELKRNRSHQSRKSRLSDVLSSASEQIGSLEQSTKQIVEEQVSTINHLREQLKKKEKEVSIAGKDLQHLAKEKEELEYSLLDVNKENQQNQGAYKNLLQQIEQKDKLANEKQKEVTELTSYLQETSEKETVGRLKLEEFINGILNRAEEAEKNLQGRMESGIDDGSYSDTSLHKLVSELTHQVQNPGTHNIMHLSDEDISYVNFDDDEADIEEYLSKKKNWQDRELMYPLHSESEIMFAIDEYIKDRRINNNISLQKVNHRPMPDQMVMDNDGIIWENTMPSDNVSDTDMARMKMPIELDSTGNTFSPPITSDIQSHLFADLGAEKQIEKSSLILDDFHSYLANAFKLDQSSAYFPKMDPSTPPQFTPADNVTDIISMLEPSESISVSNPYSDISSEDSHGLLSGDEIPDIELSGLDINSTETSETYVPRTHDRNTHEQLTNTVENQRRRDALFCVFTYLDNSELTQVSHVCQEWRDVSRHPALWRNVALSYGQMGPQYLKTLSTWCTQLQSLKLEGLMARKRHLSKEKQDDYKNKTRGYLEAGLEQLLLAAGDSLKSLSILNCGNILTDRCLWLASCYCRSLQHISYVSDTDPVGPEVLWAIGAGCRNIRSLAVPPMVPNHHPKRFNNRCMRMIGQCWPDLDAVCVGGFGIDHKGLISMAGWCQKLQHLQLDHTTEITETTVNDMCQAGLRHLRSLDLTFTPIQPAALMILQKHCLMLMSINVHIGISDFYKDVSNTSYKQQFQDRLDELLTLTHHPKLKHMLRIKANYG